LKWILTDAGCGRRKNLNCCKNKGWASASIITNLSQLVKIGKLPVSLVLSGKYYFETPSAKSYWGSRFAIVLVFPK